MEIVVVLILIGISIGVLFAGGVITFRSQPERYAYKKEIDPDTGEEYEYIIDNSHKQEMN